MPLDVYARDGEEFLRFRDMTAADYEVRLDRLLSWSESD
jgi:hypothetical protein